MNTNSKIRTCLKSTIVTAFAIANLSGFAADSAELLEKAVYFEETKGDLSAAVLTYQQILNDPAGDRGILAQAQLRLGLCALKQNDKTKAVAALEGLTGQYPDKGQLFRLVQNHVPALLDEVIQSIEQNYIREVSHQELLSTAISAIIGKLDRQSDFLTEDDLGNLKRQIAHEIAGIGIKLNRNKENGVIFVETPLPNSPALKAGIRSGDQILVVDGRNFDALPKGSELEAAAKLIQGPVGKPVSLRIKRGEKLETIEVVRGRIVLDTVAGFKRKADGAWDHLVDPDNRIGYVRVTSLAGNTVPAVRSALQQLVADGMKGLVLDLRNNPGGLLDAATELADIFLPTGTIVTIKARSGPPKVITAKPEDTWSGFPIAVLINRATASAAEIVASALQDNNRAVLIGDRTTGQGLVKEIIQLPDGKNALKLPTAEYYRPSGRAVHRFPEALETDSWGVSPDEEMGIASSEEDLKGLSQSFAAAELLGKTLNPAQFEDRQLRKAIDYLSLR